MLNPGGCTIPRSARNKGPGEQYFPDWDGRTTSAVLPHITSAYTCIDTTYDVVGWLAVRQRFERSMLHSSTWSPRVEVEVHTRHESNTLIVDAAIIFIRLQDLQRQPHQHALTAI